MDSDSDLDSILSMGWVGFQICKILWIWIRLWIQYCPRVRFQICESLWIWIWIQYCPWVGLDFKSVKSYGFGFGVGFTLGHAHRLDRIMDLFFCLDLDSGLDSFFFSTLNPNP